MKLLFTLIPHHFFSWITGILVSIPLPRVCRRVLFTWYIKRYGVNLDDISEDPFSFPCLGKFFVRNLKLGIRPIEGNLVSPVDGTLRSHGIVQNGLVLEVKGQEYFVDELLGTSEFNRTFQNGYFFNFYLAPGDYHHIHMPVTGTTSCLTHVAGYLWPVNKWAWSNVTKLLVQNERVAVLFDTEFGKVAVVLIGAFNVGSISVEIPEFKNVAKSFGIVKITKKPLNMKIGERLGTFRMGSSVVVLIERQPTAKSNYSLESKVRFGQALFKS